MAAVMVVQMEGLSACVGELELIGVHTHEVLYFGRGVRRPRDTPVVQPYRGGGDIVLVRDEHVSRAGQHVDRAQGCADVELLLRRPRTSIGYSIAGPGGRGCEVADPAGPGSDAVGIVQWKGGRTSAATGSG